MTVLSVRNVPDELMRTVKATAASEGLTLRAFVLNVLERGVKRGGWTTAPEGRRDVKANLPVILSAKGQAEPEEEEERREPLCRKPGHTGLWRQDGYWCGNCGRLYR
jgi:plasmid stability protein